MKVLGLDVETRRRVVPWLAVGVILLVAAVAYRDVTAHDFVLDDSHTETQSRSAIADVCARVADLPARVER